MSLSQVPSSRTPRQKCCRGISQTFTKRFTLVASREHSVDASVGVTSDCETSECVGRHAGTVGSTCNVTTWIQLPGQLDYDLCKLAVGLFLIRLYSRDAIIVISERDNTLTTPVAWRTNHVRVAVQVGPLSPLRIYERGQSCRIPKSASPH